jgi:lactate dehydrogenase-like 2-hydroxyacid dehydrogenase
MISLDVLPCSSCYRGFLWEWHGGNWAELDRELPDTNILITTPFHPAYITKERLAKGKNLELLVTAGIGSDHIDLRAAAEKGLTVAEVTGDGPLAHVC